MPDQRGNCEVVSDLIQRLLTPKEILTCINIHGCTGPVRIEGGFNPFSKMCFRDEHKEPLTKSENKKRIRFLKKLNLWIDFNNHTLICYKRWGLVRIKIGLEPLFDTFVTYILFIKLQPKDIISKDEEYTKKQWWEDEYKYLFS